MRQFQPNATIPDDTLSIGSALRSSLIFAASWVALALMVFSGSASAQAVDEEQLRGRPTLQQAGKLFVVEYAPKDRRINVRTAGKPVAVLDPSQITIFGRVYPTKGGPKDLKIDWSNGHFRIADPIESDTSIELEVADKRANGKTENFRFSKKDLEQAPKPPEPPKVPAAPVSPH